MEEEDNLVSTIVSGLNAFFPQVVLTSLHQIFHHLKGEQHTKVEAEIIAQANSQQGSDC